MCGIGIGIGVGLASRGAASPPPPNPNLLLRTEAFDDVLWIKTAVTIVADGATGPPPSPGDTADEYFATGANAALRQTSAVSGTVLVAVPGAITPTAAYSRPSITGTLDGTPYTFSVYVKDTGSEASGTLTLSLAGGFLRVGIENSLGDADWLLDCAQLEQAASASSYQAVN